MKRRQVSWWSRCSDHRRCAGQGQTRPAIGSVDVHPSRQPINDHIFSTVIYNTYSNRTSGKCGNIRKYAANSIKLTFSASFFGSCYILLRSLDMIHPVPWSWLWKCSKSTWKYRKHLGPYCLILITFKQSPTSVREWPVQRSHSTFHHGVTPAGFRRVHPQDQLSARYLLYNISWGGWRRLLQQNPTW